MKRSVLFSLVLMLFAAVGSVEAQTQFTIDGLRYTVIRGNTVSVSCNAFLHDTVVIPEYVTHGGVTYQVVQLDKYAFQIQVYMTHVSIPPSITGISEGCFYGSGLEKIDFPQTIQYIQSGAFQGTLIDSVYIHAALSDIEIQAFFCADSLECFTVDPANTEYCSIDGVLFSADTTLLHSYPANKRDTVYHIPDGVTGIAPGAFADNRHLRHVYLPESVENIGNDAFVSCTNLVSINIPSLATFYGNPLSWCPNLVTINIDSNHHQLKYLPQDHAIVSLDGDTLFYMWMHSDVIIVPEGVKYIAPLALAYQFWAHTLVVSEGVEKMADNACRSSHFQKVTLPSSLREIGERCFELNYRINTLNINEGLEVMGPYAFLRCFYIKKLKLPNSLKVIPEGAFCAGFYGYNEVTLGDSVTEIGRLAFYACNMTRANPLILPPTLRTIGDSAFADTELTDVVFTGEVDSIGRYAFAVKEPGIGNLTLVQDIPPRIGDNAFVFQKDNFIHIPCGSIGNYQTAPHWSGYWEYDQGDCEAVEEIEPDRLRVYAEGGSVVVEGAEGEEVDIFNSIGIRVAHGMAQTDRVSFRVPSRGLYLVRIGDRTKKVIVP